MAGRASNSDSGSGDVIFFFCAMVMCTRMFFVVVMEVVVMIWLRMNTQGLYRGHLHVR